jgi:hypothetical protein
VATTALPASAATPTPVEASLTAAATTPVEAVQYRQPARQRMMRRGYDAYAAAPRARGGYYAYGADPHFRSGYSNPWGHCINMSPRAPGASAFPEWDFCR